MITMVSTLLPRLRQSFVPWCAVVTTATLVCGCTRVLNGTVQAVVPGAGPSEPIAVSDLLIEPGSFPAQYPAVVLDPKAVYRVLQEIDGVGAGSVVTPPECAPPPVSPAHSAAVQGIDSQNAGSLIVTVTRAAPAMRGRVDQLTACPSFTSVAGEDVSSVTVSLLSPPPVDADDSYAVEQSQISETAGTMRRTLTLVAQIADVRVGATWLQDGTAGTTPNAAHVTELLDTLLTDAVLKVRRDGP
jgi:hypothetical protein